MKKLNAVQYCRATPLVVNFTNPMERDEFVNAQVKENRSHPLINGARIEDLEFKIDVINYTGEDENLNMFLFCDDGSCFSKPIKIGKDLTYHTFSISDESIYLFEGKEFNKIGFTSNKGEVYFTFEVLELSSEDRGMFLNM